MSLLVFLHLVGLPPLTPRPHRWSGWSRGGLLEPEPQRWCEQGLGPPSGGAMGADRAMASGPERDVAEAWQAMP